MLEQTAQREFIPTMAEELSISKLKLSLISINIDVLNRILKVLFEEADFNITKLATFAGLNYITCKK